MATTLNHRCADELVWELLRDEWELLLTIGAGPTTLAQMASRTGTPATDLAPRLVELATSGLVQDRGDGWSLVPTVYERQEGMSSYIRELVLDRIDFASGVPALSTAVAVGTGDEEGLRALHVVADETVLARVVDLASVPEPANAQRFVVVLAATTMAMKEALGSQEALLWTLRGASIQRARGEAQGLARVWVAEMLVAPTVAQTIAELMESFVVRQEPAEFSGVIVSGVWAVQPAGTTKEGA